MGPIPSGTEVEFGDVIKYEVEIDADGPRLFHDVKVTDWVPGYNPDDVRTTLAGTLVGDPGCVTGIRTRRLHRDRGRGDNLITWDLGDVHPDAGESVTFDHEVRRAARSQHRARPRDVHGLHVEPGLPRLRRGRRGAPRPRLSRSSAAAPLPEPVDGAPASRWTSCTHDAGVPARAGRGVQDAASRSSPARLPDMKKCRRRCPNTGAPAYLNQLALMGGLALVLGCCPSAGRRAERTRPRPRGLNPIPGTWVRPGPGRRPRSGGARVGGPPRSGAGPVLKSTWGNEEAVPERSGPLLLVVRRGPASSP